MRRNFRIFSLQRLNFIVSENFSFLFSLFQPPFGIIPPFFLPDL